jgi:hypothetical protein
MPIENLSGEELEAAWRDWARKEELRRFVPVDYNN